jgi:hypothetical protein
MRLVAGTVLIFRAVAGLSGALAIGPAPLLVFQIGLGLLLLAGLWTPIAGTLAAVLAFWRSSRITESPGFKSCWPLSAWRWRCSGPASGRLTLACLDGSASTFAIGRVVLTPRRPSEAICRSAGPNSLSAVHGRIAVKLEQLPMSQHLSLD